jgi:predicted anti-sigma-YlaC factor YlaD
VDRDCKRTIEALVEVDGDLDELGASLREHVESCSTCRGVAAAERGLHRVLDAAVAPGDAELERRIMASLEPARRRRRRVAFVPVAASSLMALFGAAVLGGVPGAGLIGQLPRLSSQLWLASADAAADWGVALTSATSAASAAMTPGLQAGAALATAAGLAAIVAVARRWRPLASWHRGR